MSKKTRKKSRTAASSRAKAKAKPRKGSKTKLKASRNGEKRATKQAVGSRRSTASQAPRTARHRNGSSLDGGDMAPSFILPRDGGQAVALSSFAGRKLVIFFYPRADTPGCTLEAMDFSRLATAFASSKTAVLGVSADSLKAQESFRDKHKLTVPLISDEKLTMLKDYGAWGKKSMYGKTFEGVLRTTVLIDHLGKIARIWRNVRVDGHAKEVLAAASAL